MKKATPAFIWCDAEVVVREGLVALESGKSMQISGRLYRLVIPLLKTPLAGWLMARVGLGHDR